MATNAPDEMPNEWWRSFFDEEYADLALDEGDAAKLDEIADFIWRTLDLKKGERILDQCCGMGRVALALAARGVEVIGVDLVPAYVERARARAAKRNLPCEFQCADAYEFTAPQPCDAAINWFTSFGYYEDDEQNLRLLERAFQSLGPGGRFLLEMISIPRVLSQFRPHIIDRHATPEGEITILVENRIDFARGMIDATWTFLRADGSRKAREISTRLIMPHEIVGLMRRAGFEEITVVGWPDGEAFSLASRRLVVMGKKP